MDYSNSQTKLETLVQYFNEERMNLIPLFQRPKVWPLKMRKELIKNIVNGRPIPAIFMYKDVAGEAFKFNILDGKQRLDSIVMFLAGDVQNRFGVRTWRNYVIDPIYRKDAGFAVDFGDRKQKTFADLDGTTMARLREYLIPTIEIELNENTSLNEMINLFVDINQFGVKVNRINIVRAMKQNDPLLKDVYDLIAERQVRRQDVFTRRKKTPFVAVLKHLKIVSTVADKTVQADRMWEKLLELALFVRSNGTHRKPTEILKSFIKKPDVPAKLSKRERTILTKAFSFLKVAYGKSKPLEESRLATDQTHFYTMATALLSGDLLTRFGEDALIAKLTKFASVIEKAPDPQMALTTPIEKSIARYRELSTEKTTDATRRKERQQELIKAIDLL
jgi:GGDEF domain-containing protein